MIKTRPEFIQGDSLTLSQYLRVLLTDKRMLYTSFSKWWKKTTLFSMIPITLGSLAVMVSLVYQDLMAGEDINWALIASLMALFYLLFLPPVWLISYYYSYQVPARIIDARESFIRNCIPEAEQIRRLSLCNTLLNWKGLEFEVAYSEIPTQKNRKGIPSHYKECILTALFYVPDHDHASEILDEDGLLRETFVDEWTSYCEGKESCRYLYIDPYAIFCFFPLSQRWDREQVENSMEQIQYLIHRFNLHPLYLDEFVSGGIRGWLDAIDCPAPADIKALNIGISETENGYLLHLTGAKIYTPENDDWACDIDFEPEEPRYEISGNSIGNKSWEEVLKIIRTIVETYVSGKVNQKDSLFYHKIVTIGFDDGDLYRII